jgi:membrane-bound serine protease (ClpP class)
MYATGATLGGIAGGIILLFVFGPRLTNTKFFGRVALADTQEKSQGFVSTSYASSMKGKKGTAYTVLRPSGKVMIDGQLYDAYTRGEFIEKDIQVVVVNDEGPSLQVKIMTE